MKYANTLASLVTTLVLTACGGGAGGLPGNDLDSLLLGVGYSNVGATMVPGRFGSDQTQYVVTTSLKYLGGGRTEPGPVKVFKLNDNGTMTDQTVAVLGGAFSLSSNVPVVADFNHDGIDDIFFPGFSDTQDLLPSVAFISRPGQSHIQVNLPDPVWAHGAVAIDVNNDGHLDVVSNWGEVWFNDGQGNFTFRTHSYQDVPGLWMHGSGVCAGDFNRTGRSQLVIVDQMVDPSIGPIADTILFELDNRGFPSAQHVLPVPVLDRGTSVETSHDVACKVADFNNDGLPDILVMSRPWAAPGQLWSNQGRAQLLLNRGNWQFDDVTDTAFPGFNTNVLVSYTPTVTDLNGDGKPDIWFGSYDYDSGKSNQAFLNNGNGTFTKISQTLVDSFSASGGTMPVLINNRWALVFARMNTQIGMTTLYLTKPIYSF